MIDAANGLFIHQVWRAAVNELFHCGPYEVKASKFLSFFALAASLPFNQPSRRQKMAQPSACKPSLPQVSGFFLERGRGWAPGGSVSPSSSRGAQGTEIQRGKGRSWHLASPTKSWGRPRGWSKPRAQVAGPWVPGPGPRPHGRNDVPLDSSPAQPSLSCLMGRVPEQERTLAPSSPKLAWGGRAGPLSL